MLITLLCDCAVRVQYVHELELIVNMQMVGRCASLFDCSIIQVYT